jgi:hypothetical protein
MQDVSSEEIDSEDLRIFIRKDCIDRLRYQFEALGVISVERVESALFSAHDDEGVYWLLTDLGRRYASWLRAAKRSA